MSSTFVSVFVILFRFWSVKIKVLSRNNGLQHINSQAATPNRDLEALKVECYHLRARFKVIYIDRGKDDARFEC